MTTTTIHTTKQRANKKNFSPLSNRLLSVFFLFFLFALLLTNSANADEVSISLDYEISDFTQQYNFTQNTLNTQRGLFVTEDGERFYHADTIKNVIYQYDLSTPYDLSTYTLNTSKSISLTYAPIWLSSDEKIFVNARANNVLDIYNNSDLDVSTMTLIGTYAITNAFFGVAFSPDGLNLFVADNSNNQLSQYVLTERYNLSTATLTETFTTTTFTLDQTCSTFQGIQVLNSGKGFLIGCSTGTPAIEGYVLYNATTPYNISTINKAIGVNFGLTQAGKTYFANNKNFYIAEDSSGAGRKIIHYTTNYENFPPNVATDIKPSNTTITLNSTGVTIPINWSGGDDNNSDTVNAQVYLRLLSNYDFITNTTSKSTSLTLDNTITSSSYYQIWLNLTDGINYTISQGDFFGLCVNDWKPSNTTCTGGLQTLVYNDDNNCPLKYDVPENNGTISACGSTGTTTTIVIEKTFPEDVTYWLAILIISFLLIFAVGNLFIPLTSIVLLFGIVFILFPYLTASMQILAILFGVSSFFASLWIYFEDTT